MNIVMPSLSCMEMLIGFGRFLFRESVYGNLNAAVQVSRSRANACIAGKMQ